jgi:hypothetical protein
LKKSSNSYWRNGAHGAYSDYQYCFAAGEERALHGSQRFACQQQRLPRAMHALVALAWLNPVKIVVSAIAYAGADLL